MKKKILAMTAAAAVAASAGASDKIVIDGSTTVGPIAKAFAEYYMAANPDVNITVSESGSGNGAKAMMNANCEIAIMSRPMKQTEFKAAAEKGIQPVAHVVALDGLPLLVHPSNPVQDLTVEQVRKIYLGEISNWKEVGGPDKAIVTISRDTNSGTYETFAKLIMNKEKIGGKCEYVGSNGAIRQRVQSTPAAIGYAGLGFVDKTVKALKINGIYPSTETVQTGEYPVARPLFMYTDGYPRLGSPLYQFVTIHLTEDGQEMVEEIGFVPVTAY
ncbi:PstS family phosphate ABC transporter substrate-binding protein [Verrucomicrobia bacterium S94]|nr:PstS family phosphate ABC transporter substrate-binding protein [Verrucomicrobia bacterium S94]